MYVNTLHTPKIIQPNSQETENFFMTTKLLEKQSEKFYTAKYDRAFKEIFLNESCVKHND